MCPSSWKLQLYVDDFPFFGSPLAHPKPELELFAVGEIMVRQIIITIIPNLKEGYNPTSKYAKNRRLGCLWC